MRDCTIYTEARIFMLAQHHFPCRMHFHRCTSLWRKLVLVGFSSQSACESALRSCQPSSASSAGPGFFQRRERKAATQHPGGASTVVQPRGIERRHRRNQNLRPVLLGFVQLNRLRRTVYHFVGHVGEDMAHKIPLQLTCAVRKAALV
jgi:hypothetical protein